MALITPTIIKRGNENAESDIIVAWSNMTFATTDSGVWVAFPGFILKSYSVYGTFGSGGAATLTQSNVNAANQAGISGAQPDEGIISVVASPGGLTGWTGAQSASYRARIDVGDGTTSLTVRMFFGKP